MLGYMCIGVAVFGPTCVGDCLAVADEHEAHQLAAVARCVRFCLAPNSAAACPELRTHIVRVLGKYSKCVPLSLSVVGFLITHQRVATSRKYYGPTISWTRDKHVIYYSPLAAVGCPCAYQLSFEIVIGLKPSLKFLGNVGI